MSAENIPERFPQSRYFRADLIISYLTVRMTQEGEQELVRNGIVVGEVWTPRGAYGLYLVSDPAVFFVETGAFPDDTGREIKGWTVALSEEMTQRLLRQQIVGVDQASGTSLRQVRIIPSSKADQI